MSNEKIAHVLYALIEKTSAGKVLWTETEQDGVFQTSFPKFSVRIFSAPSPFDDSIDYVIQVTNAEGEVIEEVRDPDLKDFFEMPFIVMRDLHESARRRAMGVDDAIDEILRALKNA